MSKNTLDTWTDRRVYNEEKKTAGTRDTASMQCCKGNNNDERV